MTKTFEEHLVNYLTDAYSIEQQALAQLHTAPDLAGEPTLAGHFRDHLVETEGQADRIRQRLEAHGGSPKRVKDAIMALGGKGFLLFARVQPDTPGKLAAHAHSYEALEWASYEMLLRMAERAGDTDTMTVARSIRDQEWAMLQRIAARFDAVADASVRGKDQDELNQALGHYLADAHALEEQSIQLLEKGEELAGTTELERTYRQHLAESRDHARRIEERLEARGDERSFLKDAALRIGGLQWGLFFQAQTDTPGKLAAFVFAVEHLEIAGYELLSRVAERAGDSETVARAAPPMGGERAMADRVAERFDLAFEASLVEKGVAVG